MTLQTTMQAAIPDRAEVPFRIAQVTRPQPGPKEVLVRIKAASVSPLDTKIRAGKAAHARQPLPVMLS